MAGGPSTEVTSRAPNVTRSINPAVSVATDDEASTTPKPCPDVMAQNDLPCLCPFPAGTYHLPLTHFTIPDIGSLKALATGDYSVAARFFDMDSGEQIACQAVQMTMSDGQTEECTGFLCLIG